MPKESRKKRSLNFIKNILKKLEPRFSIHYFLYTILTFVVIFSVIDLVSIAGATPNPGHPWNEIGVDGKFAVNDGSFTGVNTFTFPNASATVLTTNAAVTVGQGGTGVQTLATNGVLYGNGTGAVQALAVNAGAVLCLTQASSGAPAWGACGGSGTVTAVSVVTANGFAGTSSGGATPALTLTTSVTGMLKGNGTAISAATDGTDYLSSSTGWKLNGQAIGVKKTLGSTDAYDIGFLTSNTERLTILSGGNVGIGTTAPGNLLHVYKSGTGYQELLKVENPGDPGNGSTRLTVANSQASFFLQAYGSSAPGSLASAASIYAATGSRLLFGAGSGMGIQMFTNDLYTAPQFVITSGGDVGINDTTPNGTLDIDSAITTGVNFGITNTGVYTGTGLFSVVANSTTTGTVGLMTANGLTSGSILSLTSSGSTALTNQKGLNILMEGPSVTGAQRTYGAYISNTHAGTTSTNVGLYATASGGTTANYAAIFDQGNVGIGTTTPGGKLEVSSSSVGGIVKTIIRNTDTSNTANGAGIQFSPTTAGWGGAIYTDRGAKGSLGGLYFGTIDGSGGSPFDADKIRMTITNSGNVGIGDTTPNGTLDIDSAITTGVNFGITNTGVYTGTGLFSVVANSTTTGTVGLMTANGLTSGSILSLTSSGSTALTNQKGLDISLSGTNGTSTQTTYGAYISNHHAGTAVNVALYATASGGSGTSNYAAIFDAGNVGVGVTSPTARLHLAAGTATAGTAPLKFIAGANLTAPEVGALEWDGNRLYMTRTGPTRDSIAYTSDIVNSPIEVVNYTNLFSTALSAGGGASPSYSNFFGVETGANATNASYSNFLGYQSGVGATDASYSNFFGQNAGDNATNASYSNFFGVESGRNSTYASNSNFFGTYSGQGAAYASNSIFVGQNAGVNDSVDNTVSSDYWSILIGYNTNTGGYSNSVLLGGSDSGTPISNTASNQFMLADTITGVRWRGVEYNLPSAQGGAATFLQNEGNGDLSWGAAPNTLWNAIADPSGNGAIAFGSTVQTMDWGTATTQNALSITGAALTTGKLLSLTSNSLTSGTLLDITSAGTAGLTNQKGLNIALSGTNGTSAQTTYGAYISNTHAGTTSTNVGLYATASGGTTANYAAIFDQGNVGIGTTTPEGALHINVASGNPLFRNLGVTQIQTSNASGAPGLILEASPNGNTSAITMSSSGLSFWTHSGSGNYVAGDVKMTINYTGLVGVGTTSPNANLEVAQTATATGALKGFIYTGAVNTNQTLSTEIPSFTITTAGRQWATGALTTQREVLITQPTYSFVGASTITNAATLAIAGAPIKSTNASITNTHALLIQAGAVSTATNSYGLTVNAQTGATNNYAAAFLGGNVGIGTTAPSTLLEIYNSSSSYSTLYLGGTTTNTVGIRFNPTVASSDTSNGHYGVDTRINFNPQGATTTNLYTNLVIANIASSTSNIGSLFGHYISNRTAATYSGALTNAYGLYVESTTSQYLGSKPTNNYGIFVHDQTGSTNDYAIYTNLGKVRFGDTVTIGSITSGLTNASNGLIAQGATTLGGTAGNYTYPAEVRFGSGNSSRLQFAGYRKITGADWTGTTARIQYAVDSSFTDGSKAYIDIGAGDPVTSGGGLISFGTAGSNRMSILNSGNVGIGIENPVVPFQVYSNSAAVRIGDGTNTAAYLQFSSDGTSNRATVGHDGAGFAVLQGGNTKGIHLNVNNNTFGSGTAMTVLSTGNVGIGTTSPTAKFHVLGTLTDTSGYIFATINSLNASPSGASTASYYANYTQAYTGNDNISANNQLYGVFNDISHLRTVTIGGTTGFYNRVTNNTTGTINSAIGTFSTIVNNSTGTIGTAYGEVIARPTNTAGGTITNTYGLYIYNQTAAAGTQTNVPYGIYQAGTGDRNYFGSKIGVGGNSTAPASILEIGSSDLGDGVAGPVLTLGRNTNATNTGAGSINFMKKDGTAGYVWQDAAGNMRINTAAPSNANDTAGTVIGAQTSTRDTKQDIADYMDYSNALSLVVNAPLHTFRYVNEVEGYGVDSPLAKIRIGYIADEVGPEFMVGNVIDQVSVNGLLMASIKELNLKITELETNQSSSFGEYALAFFSEVIEKVDNGVVYLKGVVVGTLKIGSPERRTGITLYDEITGEPYCLSVANGENKTTPGECLVITPAASIEAINPDTTTTTTTNTETNTDTVPPVIVLNGESNLSLSVGTTYSEEGATATDDKDGLVAVIISGSVDTTTVGTYTITYNASDAAGNAAISIERIINVTE